MPRSSRRPDPRGGPARARGREGLTLTELMVVVALVGVMASLAIPTFTKSVQKARRAEALIALRGIFEHELSYFGNHSEYTDSFAALGFTIEGGALQPDGSLQGPYYEYRLATWDLGGQPNANYRATATGDIDPSDPILDIIIIENQLTVMD